MWDAQDDHFKSKGWKPKGSVYENSHWHSNRATAKSAIDSWMKSEGHRDLIFGKGKMSSKKKFGCDVYEKFANCYFQE